MRNHSITVLLSLLVITAVVGGVAYFDQVNKPPSGSILDSFPKLSVGPPPAESADPTLILSTRTTKEIAGSLNVESSNVEFESHVESPSRMSVRVQVNDLVLDASAELGEDGQKKRVIIDGHGKALSPKDKRTLIALSGLLEHHLDPYRRNLPPHEDLLARMVSLWAEAPVGFVFTRQEVRPPQSR